MVWESIKRWFGRRGERVAHDERTTHSEPVAQVPGLPWIEAADNPWGVRLLDVRPVTHTMLSTSANPQCAENAISFGQDDGMGFIGEEPPVRRTVAANLRFPIDGMLADGVLYIPRAMEHKWAIFHHGKKIICVRSWQRQVHLTADVETRPGYVEITRVHGSFGADDEDPDFTLRMFDFLLRSHALGATYPAPLPPGMEADTQAAALWCMSVFGNRAAFATPHRFDRQDPDRPLRTHSLLHIAVARSDMAAIDGYLAAGVPIDLLAADGLAPLHWALASADPAITTFLLDRGASVDVRSDEGATPLMNAVQSDSADQVRLLLDRGADADARDGRGFTALHRAAEMGHVDVLRLLLERGAAPNPEAQGHTPRSLAQAHGRAEIVALLDRYIGPGG